MALLNYGCPVRFEFGAVRHLPDVLRKCGIARPLVATDRGLRDSGLVEKVLAPLPPQSVHVFDATPANPTEQAVEAALAAYREHGCDGVVSIGGGSPMDLGKAVALLAGSGGPLGQFDPLIGGNKRVRGFAPTIMIPTTAGTGSEVSMGFVISMADGRKLTFAHPLFFARHALCDPELTLGMPPLLTAATGMDAITHCIEAVIARGDNPPADGVGLDGLWRAWRHLQRAVDNGSDRDARWHMMMAATEGAIAFVKGLGAVHSMSHAAGRIHALRLHHGTLNAVILPTVLRFNESVCAEPYARIRQAMGLAESADLAREVERMNAAVGLPAGLGAMGLTPGLIDDMVPHAVADLCTRTNPRDLTAADFAGLFRQAM